MASAIRLVALHELNDAQWRELLRIMSDDRVTRWLSDGAQWSTEKLLKLREYSAHDAAIATGKRDYFYWGIVIDEGALAGIIGLHPSLPAACSVSYDILVDRAPLQIMIAIDPARQGRGIARAALDVVITREFLRELGRDVQVIINERNIASIRAFERWGKIARDTWAPSFKIRRTMYRAYRVRV